MLFAIFRCRGCHTRASVLKQSLRSPRIYVREGYSTGTARHTSSMHGITDRHTKSAAVDVPHGSVSMDQSVTVSLNLNIEPTDATVDL